MQLLRVYEIRVQNKFILALCLDPLILSYNTINLPDLEGKSSQGKVLKYILKNQFSTVILK
jgi:hypothetical protein